jgi:hypothetical protein
MLQEFNNVVLTGLWSRTFFYYYYHNVMPEGTKTASLEAKLW